MNRIPYINNSNTCRLCFQVFSSFETQESYEITKDFLWKFKELTNYEVSQSF